ncbi:zinc ribbon domain-containing protein [Halotalea alkalilenta]|uniref:zinc ribbon domain-containing protein n=1 Tax=Halotalea alkalilenta TaxID=376489 RepID=UPI000484ADBA|nr:zinc ribbon domain-containing protein [Halotalea alkalilenta]
MPLYDYKCVDHGLFHALVPVSASGERHPCPGCGLASPRVILLAPSVLAMAPEKRRAIARNERAAHEPRSGSQHSEREQGCCHHARRKPNVFYTAQGEKLFPSARPWMISH